LLRPILQRLLLLLLAAACCHRGTSDLLLVSLSLSPLFHPTEQQHAASQLSSDVLLTTD